MSGRLRRPMAAIAKARAGVMLLGGRKSLLPSASRCRSRTRGQRSPQRLLDPSREAATAGQQQARRRCVGSSGRAPASRRSAASTGAPELEGSRRGAPLPTVNPHPQVGDLGHHAQHGAEADYGLDGQRDVRLACPPETHLEAAVDIRV